jgi:hypothetical protein
MAAGPWAAALALAALGGCSDEPAEVRITTYPVKGKVLLPDGKPLTDGSVTFVPTGKEGLPAGGKIEPDGTFTLTTRSPGDGAGAGDYRVKIVSDAKDPASGGKKAGRGLVPNKYLDEDSSGLTATVKAEPNDLPPFKLDTKPAPNAKSAVNSLRD